tara:strand:- start:687 stop:956 length:270 start_codon:yes stop_codon:yes gene_type:complete
MKYCTNCGSQLSDTDKFCPNCGQSSNKSSNDSSVKADLKVEVVNTNTDKVIKAGKEVISKNSKYVNYSKWAILILIGSLVLSGLITYLT